MNAYLSIQEAIRTKPKVRPASAGTKPALSSWGNLSLASLSGILDYNPQEYTFTALAGTPLKMVEETLAHHGQYLPFDPPLVKAGATLGGTVAAGLSGPGRFRYGGVRDFLLGVKFISGDGTVHSGGGKVVKNAAGFDFPKLMVGSLGRYGILLELTFKVFPKPERYKTLKLEYVNSREANRAMQILAMSGSELSCLDFLPPATLLLRVGGLDSALDQRLENIQQLSQEGEIIAEDETLWQEIREFAFYKQGILLKIPLNPRQVIPFEDALEGVDVPRRYSVGGNVVYLEWNGTVENLNSILNRLDLSALVLKGYNQMMLGKPVESLFSKKLLSVLDPKGKFAI